MATTNGTYVLSRLSGAAMLTVTMVRKADNSGYRLFITPEMEGYPSDECRAAAYMNKIIEKEIMRAPSSISGSTVASKRARWVKPRCISEKKGRKAFLFLRLNYFTPHLLWSSVIRSL